MPSNNKAQIIYKLNGIDADDGVDVFEIAPVLMNFGELLRSSGKVLGYDQKIDIKIKPFREGSWITDFVINQSEVHNLLTFLKTDQGRDLSLLLAFLGLGVKDGIVGLINIIRFTKGIVTNYSKDDEKDKITYFSPTGEKLEVTLPEHRLVQSPLIQNNYYNCTVVPFEKFPATTSIGLKSNIDNHEEEIITEEDKEFIEQYAHAELLDDAESNITMLNGILLKPKRGSYSGEEKSYSFIMADTTLWPVTIDDEDFIKQLTKGEIRLYSEDVLKVDLEIKQKRDASNKIGATYAIKKVHEYLKFEKPTQMKLG